MTPFIIAIDGYSSCGKSTLARDLASELGFRHIDSGAMYRAVTWLILESQLDTEDRDGISALLSDMHMDFPPHGSDSDILLGGRVLKDELRTSEVDQHVSLVASMSMIRKKLVEIQQSIGASNHVIMDGRDIGSVVFPDAPLKLFVTADIRVRTERRFQEIMRKGMKANYQEVKSNLLERDHKDMHREHSPLVKTQDAVVIDNTNLNRSEQLEMTLALAKYRIEKH